MHRAGGTQSLFVHGVRSSTKCLSFCNYFFHHENYPVKTYVFTEYQETHLCCFLMHPRVPQCCSTRELIADGLFFYLQMSLKLLACVGGVIFSILLICGSTLSQSANMFLKEPSTEGLVLVIVLVLFQLLPGFYISRIKCESLKSYRRTTLERKAGLLPMHRLNS